MDVKSCTSYVWTRRYLRLDSAPLKEAQPKMSLNKKNSRSSSPLQEGLVSTPLRIRRL